MSFYPAKFGTAEFGSSRFGQCEPQELPGSRPLTRRRANFNVPRDPQTGRRYPKYSEDTVDGVLVLKGGQTPAFAAGVYMKLDAVFFTLDGFKMMDQVKEIGSPIYYRVQEIELRYKESGEMAFRACHMDKQELFREGT